MAKRIFVLGLLGFLVSGLCGCALFPKKNKDMATSQVLEPQMQLRFADVPVPAGFKLLERESYSFENTGVRVGVLKYQGKVNADRVVNFYKEQMPMYNWNLLNSVEYGQRLLNFDREQETCIITLLPKGSSTVITVSLGPKSQMPKKATKPVK